jgi:hypothetical protein
MFRAMMHVRWAPLPGARQYRLQVIDLDTQEPLLTVGPLSAPECSLPVDGADSRRLGGVLWWRSGRFGRWARWGPAGALAGDHGDGSELDLPVNHIRVRDIDRAVFAQDEVVLGARAPRWHDFELTHQLLARHTPWTGSAWGEPGEWTLPPVQDALGPVSAGASACTSPCGLLLLFTIDTEGGVHRMRDPDPARVVQELVFGGDGGLGIELHMDLLEHFGARGCFFLDVLMEYSFGRDPLQRVIEAILSRGHEIELHVHGEHLIGVDDARLRSLAGALGDDDPARFRALLELSVDLFERRVGRRPVAYRAGGYRVCDAHLDVLPDLGIAIDASVQTWFHSRVSDTVRAHTQPFWLGDLLEVPPSWYLHQTRGGRDIPYAFAPIAGGTSAGCVVAMRPCGPEPAVASYVSHSFQFLRAERISDPAFRARWIEALAQRVGDPASVPDDGYTFVINEPARDEEMVASAVRVLRAVSERPDARCTTYAELHRLAGSERWWRSARSVDPVPVFDASRGRTGLRTVRIGSDPGVAPVPGAAGRSIPQRLLGLADTCATADVALALGDHAGLAEAGLADEIRSAVAPGEARLLWAAGYFETLAPAALADAARDAYASLQPGSDALLHVASDCASEVLAHLVRAGFVVARAERYEAAVAAHLVRPFDVADIDRLASRP